MYTYVYVQASDGTPLMQTRRFNYHKTGTKCPGFLITLEKQPVIFSDHGLFFIDTVLQKPSGRKKRHIKKITADLMEKKERRKKIADTR